MTRATCAKRPAVGGKAGRLARRLQTMLLIGLTLAIAGCRSRNALPGKTSEAYAKYVSNFYVGLAALQVGDDVRAESSLSEATKLVAGEPAGWANWGILALRQRNFDAAAERFGHAQQLDSSNDQLFYLQGLLESDRGNSGQAIDRFRQAVKLNPRNVRATYLLASEVERQGDAHSDADFQQLMQQVIAAQPGNLAALLELCRVSAKRGDAATLRSTLSAIEARSSGWPAEVKEQLTALQAAANSPDVRTAATRSIFLRNVLMRVPEFRASLSELKAQPGEEASPFTHFLKLESPAFQPAAADAGLTFTGQPFPSIPKGTWSWIGALYLDGQGPPVAAVADGASVRLATGVSFSFPGAGKPPQPESILQADLNYDFKTDLVLAGSGGLRFMRQTNPGSFEDVSAQTKLPKAILNAAYSGLWAADIEADGDLDIVAAQPGAPLTVLRNNGDNTFTPLHPFAGVSGVRQFAWADLNDDGNPDAAIIDGNGRLHIFLNQRSGNFREDSAVPAMGDVQAIATGDLDHAAPMTLAVLAGGKLAALHADADSGQWRSTALALDGLPASTNDVRLRIADLDNNGQPDILLTPLDVNQPARIWLRDDAGRFVPLAKGVAPGAVMDVADLRGNGRLDLLALSSDGVATQQINQGTRKYHWQTIRPRARQTTGDQRVNPFGIGGQIEIRSGLSVQKQSIATPELHFGLGDETGVDVARIVWPNGSVRAEFALKADQPILTEQRLKGSCPFLFAYNGRQMQFVKDTVPWGAAIGLRINSLGSPRIDATEEWYKIAGDQLAARNGYYDLRITGELWESYYYDSLRLMAVDHPAGTEIFTDERFAVPAVKPAITVTGPLRAIARATDDLGSDVTGIVAHADDRYLDTFGRGQYQGVTREHFVEIDLGPTLPAGPLWLVAKGWVHPSDSSLNIAMAQGSHERPQPLSLEVADGHGGWKVLRGNLGFPAGRKKNCLIDLTGAFADHAPHRIRLKTNLEVYWDSIEWAQGMPASLAHIVSLDPASAELRYRGYSTIHQNNASSPEIPDYNHLAATTQIWRDLTGYYTRYGDVRPLLAVSDDRYVIMNAGDELALKFKEPQPPAAGLARDYVLAGDGWIKDGDYNSTNSRSVLPYPYHARKDYNEPPKTLEEEWVYQHHKEDWATYQTRYVTPRIFTDALRSSTRQ